MTGITRTTRSAAIVFKTCAFAFGGLALITSLAYITNEYAFFASVNVVSFNDIVMILALLGTVFSGLVLLATLPTSFRVKFKRPQILAKSNATYGFYSMLGIGLGATLGSPLFILIPLNIIQFEFISLLSLVLAALLSILMARVYGDMYSESRKMGLDGMGGPSFTKAATGTRSARYFVSRLSMWIANTALAAYSKIVFVVFDFELMPGILAGYGINGLFSQAVVWGITIAFLAWTAVNVLFEQHILRLIGYIQGVLTSFMVIIIVFQSYLLGAKGSWSVAGLLHFSGSGNWIVALVINTGYLYLLFYGFQEIQALEREAVERSTIPIVSWIKKGYTLSKEKYLGLAMILSVIIAAAINILYGLSVFATHPNALSLSKSEIPALYISNLFLGPDEQLLTGIVFLIATITTFVPAFLAASRHLGALVEDGFLPKSFSKFSYGFTLVAILILALGNENFLISIIDFLVLLSLGIICLSGIWIKKHRLFTMNRTDALPLIVGISCFVAGGAQYFLTPTVAVFGTLAIAIAYFTYVVYELGSFGSQLFLGLFNVIVLVVLTLYPHTFAEQSFFLFQWLNIPTPNTHLLSVVLGASSLFLFSNATADLYLRRKEKNHAMQYNY